MVEVQGGGVMRMARAKRVKGKGGDSEVEKV